MLKSNNYILETDRAGNIGSHKNKERYWNSITQDNTE